jgi:hypothetical protein
MGARPDAGDEVAFYPVRILMPDSSGIPLADLAAIATRSWNSEATRSA